MFFRVILIGLAALFSIACSEKPSQVSDDFWQKYKILGAPKLLYQCGEEIGYSAGIGIAATYNHLLNEAQRKCDKDFKILSSQQHATENK